MSSMRWMYDEQKAEMRKYLPREGGSIIRSYRRRNGNQPRTIRFLFGSHKIRELSVRTWKAQAGQGLAVGLRIKNWVSILKKPLLK